MTDLAACTSGDKRAWDAFVARWSPIIYAAAHRTLGRRGRNDPEEVADVAQDVFVRLVKGDFRLLKTYDPARASLSTWLTLVTRSVAIDRLRRRRLDAGPLQEVAAPEPRAAPVQTPAVPLHLLTERQRLVVRLLFDEDMTVESAARVMGVDSQTVRSTKHKALSRLREHLGGG